MTEKMPPAFPQESWALAIDELTQKGRAVLPACLPAALWQGLQKAAQDRFSQSAFHEARIGRGITEQRKESIRGDSLCWLQDNVAWEAAWLNGMETLRCALNQTLYLGLNEYEAHFSHYPVGAFYQKHRDRHRDSNARVVTTVFYLNKDWQEKEGGELVIYDENEGILTRELPTGGKLVLFMSEGVLHEVLPATRERWSIAGWFRR
jgi:SM-20-related protein